MAWNQHKGGGFCVGYYGQTKRDRYREPTYKNDHRSMDYCLGGFLGGGARPPRVRNSKIHILARIVLKPIYSDSTSKISLRVIFPFSKILPFSPPKRGLKICTYQGVGWVFGRKRLSSPVFGRIYASGVVDIYINQCRIGFYFTSDDRKSAINSRTILEQCDENRSRVHILYVQIFDPRFGGQKGRIFGNGNMNLRLIFGVESE